MRVSWLLLLAAAGLAADAESVRIALQSRTSAEVAPLAPAPLLRLVLTEKRPAGAAFAGELSPRARFASCRLFGKDALLAFDAPEGTEALGLLYASGGKGAQRGRAVPTAEGFTVRFDAVPCAGGLVNLVLAYRGRDLAEATLAPAEHRRGRGFLGGTVREVLLVDGDGDGRYDGAADRWVALRGDRAAALPPLALAGMMLLAEPQVPFEEDGRAFAVAAVAADGSACVLSLDAPRVPAARVIERRHAEIRAEHFARFRREEAALAAERGLDRARPRVASPAAWPLRTLAEAKEEARRARKPLLVHFFTEANAYCWLAEYCTYPDREVDALLRGCVLASIDSDKDTGKSYQALGLKALPAVVPFTAAGERITFDLGVRGADGKITELKGEQAITGWHRPQEFALNLRRALGR